MQWLKGKKNRPVIFYPLSENKNKIIDPVDDSVTFRRALDTDIHIRHVNSERRLVFKRPTFATSECFVVKSGHRAAARKFLLVSPWRLEFHAVHPLSILASQCTGFPVLDH